MGGATDRPTITPEMNVATMLEHYPGLESVLIELAPSFEKLQNPALRSAVAGVTTVRQVADTQGISIGDMIGKLRSAAGCPQASAEEVGSFSSGEDRPEWLHETAVVNTLDAREQIQSGGHPLPTVMAALGDLEPEQVYALIAPFAPTPLIEKARAAGCVAWTEQLGPEEFKTYFRRA